MNQLILKSQIVNPEIVVRLPSSRPKECLRKHRMQAGPGVWFPFRENRNRLRSHPRKHSSQVPRRAQKQQQSRGFPWNDLSAYPKCNLHVLTKSGGHYRPPQLRRNTQAIKPVAKASAYYHSHSRYCGHPSIFLKQINLKTFNPCPSRRSPPRWKWISTRFGSFIAWSSTPTPTGAVAIRKNRTSSLR